jgi:uncharacterized membrane protein
VKTTRLEAFSDGVMAIIITIMVLELKVPEGHTFADLRHTAGKGLLSYVVSYVYVGIYWNNHHHMFQLVKRVSGGVLWANLGLLFCLSLFPFTTDWTDASHYARTPVVVYGVNLLAAGFAYFVLQTVIIRSQGKGSALRRAVGADRKGRLSMVGYLAGCIAAAFSGGGTGWDRPGIWVAVGLYVVVALVWVIPDRRIETFIVTHEPLDGDPEQQS